MRLTPAYLTLTLAGFLLTQAAVAAGAPSDKPADSVKDRRCSSRRCSPCLSHWRLEKIDGAAEIIKEFKDVAGFNEK